MLELIDNDEGSVASKPLTLRFCNRVQRKHQSGCTTFKPELLDVNIFDLQPTWYDARRDDMYGRSGVRRSIRPRKERHRFSKNFWLPPQLGKEKSELNSSDRLSVSFLTTLRKCPEA